MKTQLLATTAAAALLLLAQTSGARAGQTIVGTIYGSYDALCQAGTGNAAAESGFSPNIDCTFGTGLTPTGNGTDLYDTPNLFIANSGSKPFTGLSLSLTGYQGLNLGKTGSIGPITVAPGTIYQFNWDGSPPGLLTEYDYDDEYGQTTTNAACDSVGQGDCAKVGNFDVHLSGTLNGNPIASDFSPDNAQDGGNQAGKFVGWEGIDPNGWSESTYDSHETTTPGVLAYIYTGTTGKQTVPEPASLSLLGMGLGALAVARRRRKSG